MKVCVDARDRVVNKVQPPIVAGSVNTARQPKQLCLGCLKPMSNLEGDGKEFCDECQWWLVS